jgi:hypothetical protein
LSEGIKYLGLGLLSMLLSFSSCQKKDSALPFSAVPEIRLIGLSHDTIVEYKDVLTITFHYQDGDGDLGFEEPDRYAVYIRDARLTTYDGFFLGPIAPPGITVPIKGRLSVEFPSLFVFGNRIIESTRFFIYVIDRAGNKSNELETATVYIVKPN